MALNNSRLCVFCGQGATEKTREHVVPFWLLEMTGDPKRVVTFGQDFKRGKQPIRYAWSSFVAPACAHCNNKFSDLEGRVKTSIEILQRREALSVAAYIELLDWLDKVRIGVWLTRHMIENHPVEITPHFYISARIAAKDRMVAVYVFEGDNRGINLLGSDSLIFNHMPSFLGLRINNILLLNISSDFFCSKGCGLPHPTSMKMIREGPSDGQLQLEGVGYAEKVSNPITNIEIFKPVVWLYQPIKLPHKSSMFQGGYYGHVNVYDSRLSERTLLGNERQGALFRQYKDRVEILRDESVAINFDDVVGEDCATLGQIAASIYDVQHIFFSGTRYKWIKPAKPDAFHKQYRRLCLSNARALANLYRRGR